MAAAGPILSSSERSSNRRRAEDSSLPGPWRTVTT